MAINVYILSIISITYMAFSDKNVEINFEKIIDNLKTYFSNLTNFQEYAWIAIGIGILFIIISLIIW